MQRSLQTRDAATAASSSAGAFAAAASSLIIANAKAVINRTWWAKFELALALTRPSQNARQPGQLLTKQLICLASQLSSSLPPPLLFFGVASGEARMHYQLLNSKSLNMFKYFAYSSRGSSQLSLLRLILLLLFFSLRHLPSGKTQKRRHTLKPWQKKWTVLKCSSISNCCCCSWWCCCCCCSERKTTKPKLKNHQLRQAGIPAEAAVAAAVPGQYLTKKFFTLPARREELSSLLKIPCNSWEGTSTSWTGEGIELRLGWNFAWLLRIYQLINIRSNIHTQYKYMYRYNICIS